MLQGFFSLFSLPTTHLSNHHNYENTGFMKIILFVIPKPNILHRSLILICVQYQQDLRKKNSLLFVFGSLKKDLYRQTYLKYVTKLPSKPLRIVDKMFHTYLQIIKANKFVLFRQVVDSHTSYQKDKKPTRNSLKINEAHKKLTIYKLHES